MVWRCGGRCGSGRSGDGDKEPAELWQNIMVFLKDNGLPVPFLYVTGTQTGSIEWDVKDCMQSRQDYIIAVDCAEVA